MSAYDSIPLRAAEWEIERVQLCHGGTSGLGPVCKGARPGLLWGVFLYQPAGRTAMEQEQRRKKQKRMHAPV